MTTTTTRSEDDVRLRRTWFEFLRASASDGDFASERGHVHGFDREDDPAFELSALQRITALRVEDYRDVAGDENVVEGFLSTARSSYARANLRDVVRSRAPRTCLAAEFKRRSPSKGRIGAEDARAGDQAVVYRAAGADVISVLTEGPHFGGSLADLTEARRATTNADDADDRPAILRKDFIVTEVQIAEAASAGADTVLLIVAVTPATLLQRLIDFCRSSCGMEPLVEVHAPAELDVALNAGARVVGVNNRNLHTFSLDLNTTDRTAAELERRGVLWRPGASDGVVLCSLSGMSSADDVHRYRRVGVAMVLIGESLMRAADPGAAIEALCLDPEDYERSRSGHVNGDNKDGAVSYDAGTKVVKVCGITNPDDAVAACRAGANLIGVIFAERSKRRVDAARARAVVDAVRAFGERADRVGIPLPDASDDVPLVVALARRTAALEAACRHRPLVVGVFQNHSSDEIADVVAASGVDLVQLHGAEGSAAAAPDKCGGVPALRVVDVPADRTTDRDAAADAILAELTADPVAVLLDTTVRGAGAGGGTGATFDHGLATVLQKERGLPVLVAGGLKPDNVGALVADVGPWGVDVSSGTEAAPGRKDLAKVESFVTNARRASTTTK